MIINQTASATYRDIVAAPVNRVAEILFGKLVLHPASELPHCCAVTGLTRALYRCDDAWVILPKIELHIRDHIVVPDMARWHSSQIDVDEHQTVAIPNWCCDVFHPDTKKFDIVEKRQIYADAGVSYLWHIDPSAKTLEAYELRENNWLLTHVRSEDDTCDVPPFEAAPFNLGVLWSR